MSKIRAITFDLWDTIFCDNTDEAKRQSAGRLSKSLERRFLVHRFLEKHKSVDKKLIDAVYDKIDNEFKREWNVHHTTWTVEERISKILNELNRELPEQEKTELIKLHEEMELEFRPDVVRGVREALVSLQGKYKLGVISDTIFSPGRVLRELLRDEGLYDFFEVCIFSDEAGKSKPHPLVFESALKSFAIEPHELVHIGDRELKDIEGAKNIGARAILCKAIIDRGNSNSIAHTSFDDYEKLPEIIDAL
ncbi:HAD family hydrolase [Spirochaetota bacterium]